MDLNPLVSVIIPTYNDSEYLCEAIDSVLAQTYEECEIIVVDDGSTQDTKELLRSYLHRITYIYKENGGVGSTRNVGIKNSKGLFLAFLDADDLWLPRKLELQVRRFQTDPELGVVFTDQCSFDKTGIVSHTKTDTCRVHEGMVFEKLFSGNFIGISTVMVKRSCIAKIGLFDQSGEISTIEDINFFLRLARYFPFGYVNQVLVKYRLHADNMSADFEKMYTQDFVNFDKITALFQDLDLGNASYVKKGKAQYRFDFGLCYFQRNEYKKARKQFVMAVSFWPLHLRGWLYIAATFLPIVSIQYIREIKRFPCLLKGKAAK